MENSCREEGELSDDENEDVIITHTLSAEAVKSKSNDQVIVIDDDDDYGDNSPGLMSHEVQVGSKPLSALNSLTQNTIEPKSYKRENVGSHRKKHKKSSDSKYRQIKHRNEGGTYEMKRSSVIKNNLSGSRKKAPEEIHRKTSNSNISGQSGFMDKMRGRYKYQGSGTMGDLLKTRSSLKVKHNISINPNDSTERKHTSKKVNSQNVQKSEVTVALESSPDRSMSEKGPKKADSPLLDEEQEYAHLLLEYKEIQEKLADLQQEEKSQLKTGTAENILESAETQTVEKSTMEDKTEVVDMELASSEDEASPIKIIEKENIAEEDEDTYLLELRLAALESAARAKKSAFAKETADLPISKEKQEVKRSTTKTAPARRRQRSQQRSSSALRSLQLEEDRLHRERERMWREKERIRQLQAELLYERDMIDRWHEKHLKEDVWMGEIQRILSTADKGTKYQRVLELFGLDERAVPLTRSNHTGSSSQKDDLCHSESERYPTTAHRHKRQSRSQSPNIQPESSKELANERKTPDTDPEHQKADIIKQINTASALGRETGTASPATSKSGSEEEEEGEDILRAKLLASVARRRRELEQQRQVLENRDVASESDGQDSPSAQESQSVSVEPKADSSELVSDPYRRRQPTPSVMAIPKHKPVIIDLHEDSSDESDGEPPYKQSRISGETQSGSFIGSLDSFLKAARKSVERQTSLGVTADPHTPDALKHLGSHKVQEYKMLKEEIRKREKKRLGKWKAGKKTDLVVTVSDDQHSPTRDVVIQATERDSEPEREVIFGSSERPHDREVILQRVDTRENNMDVQKDESHRSSTERQVVLHQRDPHRTDRGVQQIESVNGDRVLQRSVINNHSTDRPQTIQELEPDENNTCSEEPLRRSESEQKSGDIGGTESTVPEGNSALTKVVPQSLEIGHIATDSDSVMSTRLEVEERVSTEETLKQKEPCEDQLKRNQPENAQSEQEALSQDESHTELVDGTEVRSLQPKQLKQLRLKVALQRRLIDQEQQQIQEVRHLINKKKAVVKLAEQKIQKMKEQMMATQTVFKANLQQISMLNHKAQSLQGKMDTRREKLVSLEKKLQEMKPLSLQSHSNTTITLAVPQSPGTESTERTADTVVSVDQLQEKTRLIRLEQKYAAMIKSYKESQASLVSKSTMSEPSEPKISDQRVSSKRRTSWGFGSRLGTPAKPKTLEHVKTEETMQVGRYEEPQDSLSALRKRRRSSLYSEQITQPDLGTKMEEQELELTQSDLDTKIQGHVATGDRLGSEVTVQRPRSDSKGLALTASGERIYPGVTTEITELRVRVGRQGERTREASPSGENSIQMFNSPTEQHLQHLKRLHMENLVNPSIFSTSSDTGVKSKSVISELIYSARTSSDDALTQKPWTFRNYSSPLLKFKSYRLSPYFRTKSGLKVTSVTYNSQIAPSAILCRYDLMGKCNDDLCPWQHEGDYRLQGELILQDLLAYAPQLAGVTKSTPLDNYSQLIESFAEQFSKQNEKMTLDQQCILLSSQVNSATSRVVPHTMHFEARKWKPKACVTRHSLKNSDLTDKDVVTLETSPSIPSMSDALHASEDDVLCEEDVRYWMLSAEEIQDMESSVIDNPKQTHVWIKLAYKKLHGSGKGREEVSVNEALSILSRGLEANRDSVDLWLHYLSVYRQKQDLSDLYHLHKQAVHFAPCYPLYWKFLKLQPSYEKKMQLCCDMVEFLCKETPSEINSQRLLEVTLYKVQLTVLTGRIKSAKNIFRNVLHDEEVTSLLTQRDLVLAWLCYIHLYELLTLPHTLFSSSDSNPGELLNKSPFVIEWSSSKPGKASRYTTLCSLLQDALTLCSQTTAAVVTDTKQTGETPALLPLYQNAVHLHLAHDRNSEAKEMCSQVLTEYSKVAEAWIFCHDVELKQGNHLKAAQLLEEAVRALPTEPCLQHVLAVYLMRENNQNAALEVLELCPFHFFDLPEEEESEVKDPNLLYSILLKLPTPLQCELPTIKADITEDKIKVSLPFLWLNYCHLLELQGCEESEVIDAYETALSSLSDTKHVKLLWNCYLDHFLLQIQSTVQSSQNFEFRKFCDLVHRCLMSVPVRVPVPCDLVRHYTDYSFHTQLIDRVLISLPASQHSAVYEDFLRLMPTNTDIIIRACKHFYSEGEMSRALGTCAVVFEDLATYLPVCKMYLSLMYQSGNMKEVQRMYSLATQKLPYCIWLWKNYLLFEATWGTGERVKQLVQQCRDLGVNIEEFIATVLRC